MSRAEPPGVFDLGGLKTARGILLGTELVLSLGVVALLSPPAPPTLAPALLQAVGGGAALGGLLLRDPPRLSPGYGTCLDLLRAISGTLIFLVVALVALASSRDALAATTFTFSLILAFIFAFDVFVTFRTRVAPGQDADTESS
ncbi:CKLF-like MARVEL transmembrane domain-containing protein 5 isoform X1 [Chamaea fasciata]|uniref:CKLF-like MARVEL transmembrane domain-containing protein 5 isoform X1 n=1 Tax=Chamaea fasciata TaxID=190680 RepID=UPI00336A1609